MRLCWSPVNSAYQPASDCASANRDERDRRCDRCGMTAVVVVWSVGIERFEFKERILLRWLHHTEIRRSHYYLEPQRHEDRREKIMFKMSD